jgi:hypothetical protein
MMTRQMLIVSFLLVLSRSGVARAERFEATVLLEARNRQVVITHQEPGAAEEIRIDEVSYRLTGADSAGSPGAYNFSGDRPEDSVSILGDRILLARMKQNPWLFSKSLQLHNADEVTCPRDSNAILMLIRKPGAERVGNCLQLTKR